MVIQLIMLIKKCMKLLKIVIHKGISEILIITGKGHHSKYITMFMLLENFTKLRRAPYLNLLKITEFKELKY